MVESSIQAHCWESSQHSVLCMLSMLRCGSQLILTWKSHECCKECPQSQVVMTGSQVTSHWPQSQERIEKPPTSNYLLSHQVILTPLWSSQLTVSISPRGTDAVLTAWPGHLRGCMSAAQSVAQKVDSWFCFVESPSSFIWIFSIQDSGWIWFIRDGIWSTSLQGIETGNVTFVQTSDDTLKSQGWIPHNVSLVGESTVSPCPHQRKLFWESFTPN